MSRFAPPKRTAKDRELACRLYCYRARREVLERTPAEDIARTHGVERQFAAYHRQMALQGGRLG